MSVDDVAARLDRLVDQARRASDRKGYFATLYQAVTHGVREGLHAGRFEDPQRMERLVSTFARRYLDAQQRFESGQGVPLCWRATFSASGRWRPVVLQHLLLGMNAHINFDLGIACALTAPGPELAALRTDFDAINAILAGLTEDVEQALTRVWPSLRLIDALGGRTDEAILNFSIERARDAAWAAAQRLAALDAAAQEAELRRIDLVATALSQKILYPGIKLTLALLVVRLQERGNVRKAMRWLSEATQPPAVRGIS